MIYGIILAGGAGTRFWPLSRENHPKQLLKLFSNNTLIEETINRIEPIVDDIYISTGKNLEKKIKQEIPNAKLIVEPARRDTAAAIGLCASKFNEEDILIFLPADAYIRDIDNFREDLKKAIKLATNKIVVIGIKPRSPSTAYGYIAVNNESKVMEFKEKPNLETAKKYLNKGFLWNAGIFVCKVSVLMNLFKKYTPSIFNDISKMKETGNIEEIYPKIEKISFDFAIMEKAEEVSYVKSNFYWNDVGSFDALYEVLGERNSTLNGELVEINSEGNIVSSKKTIALIDCEDLVVIDTNDSLLVCPKKSVQKIKELQNKINQALK